MATENNELTTETSWLGTSYYLFNIGRVAYYTYSMAEPSKAVQTIGMVVALPIAQYTGNKNVELWTGRAIEGIAFCANPTGYIANRTIGYVTQTATGLVMTSLDAAGLDVNNPLVRDAFNIVACEATYYSSKKVEKKLNSFVKNSSIDSNQPNDKSPEENSSKDNPPKDAPPKDNSPKDTSNNRRKNIFKNNLEKYSGISPPDNGHSNLSDLCDRKGITDDLELPKPIPVPVPEPTPAPSNNNPSTINSSTWSWLSLFSSYFPKRSDAAPTRPAEPKEKEKEETEEEQPTYSNKHYKAA